MLRGSDDKKEMIMITSTSASLLSLSIALCNLKITTVACNNDKKNKITQKKEDKKFARNTEQINWTTSMNVLDVDVVLFSCYHLLLQK